MDSSGSPGTATFGNDSSSGSTGMIAVPAIADSPDTQQSASSGISHDLSHSGSCRVVQGRRKEEIVISFIIDTEKEREGRHESCEKGKRAIQIAYRRYSPSKITQENKTLKQEVEEAKRNLAMLQESYERDDQGNVTRIQELERRAGVPEQQVAHILKRSDEQLREAAQYIDIQRGKTKLSEDQAKLEHRIRCEEESSLVSKTKAEQERRSTSSEIAQYQSMINSYQVKITTDSQNEENTIRGWRERLETALLPATENGDP